MAGLTAFILILVVLRLQHTWSNDAQLAKDLLTVMRVNGTGVVTTDKYMHILKWGENMQELTGWKDSEVVGTNFADYVLDGLPSNHYDLAHRDDTPENNTHKSRIMVVTCTLLGSEGQHVRLRIRTYTIPAKSLYLSVVDKIENVIIH